VHDAAMRIGELSRRTGVPVRSALADRLETFTDERIERYWQLLAKINGWPIPPSTTPAWSWLIAALRARR
jgi:hypothetical protein